MRYQSEMLGVGIAALSGLLAANAQAQALPAPVVFMDGTGPTSGLPGAGINFATASYQNGTAQISYNSAGAAFNQGAPLVAPSGGSASVTYSIEVLGPANVNVPVDFLASGTSSPSSNKSGSAVSASLGSNPVLWACNVSGTGFCRSFAPTVFLQPTVYEVPTNTPLQVQITAIWSTGNSGDGVFGGGAASGYVSASQVIDSAWNQAGYTLLSSASAVTVPEPESYGMMLGGLLLAFIVSRRAARDPLAQ